MTDELANSIQLFLQQEKMLGAHVLTVIEWRTDIRVGHISIAVFLHCKGFCCQSELAAFGPEALSHWGRGIGPKMERLRLWGSTAKRRALHGIHIYVYSLPHVYMRCVHSGNGLSNEDSRPHKEAL